MHMRHSPPRRVLNSSTAGDSLRRNVVVVASVGVAGYGGESGGAKFGGGVAESGGDYGGGPFEHMAGVSFERDVAAQIVHAGVSTLLYPARVKVHEFFFNRRGLGKSGLNDSALMRVWRMYSFSVP